MIENNEQENKQFIKLPTKKSSEKSDLIPEEEFIYIGLRSFLNGESKKCNPSYRAIADKLKIKGVDTVSKYLKSLEQKGYIKIYDNGIKRSKDYEFIKDLPNFEKFNPEFISSENFTFQQKSFLTSIQRLQYKEQETGIGNISYQIFEIADKINTTPSIVNKRIKELTNKGIIEVEKTNAIDTQTGLKKNLYKFDLTKYNPIIRVLVKHELDIQDIISVLTPEQKAEIEKRRKEREIIL